MTRHLVQHNAFIALRPSRTSIGDVGDDVVPSYTTAETSAGRPERATSKPHRCLSCGSICFLPAEGVGRDSFVEEVRILMFCVFLIDYMYICVCVCVCVYQMCVCYMMCIANIYVLIFNICILTDQTMHQHHLLMHRCHLLRLMLQ
jgi:hypothetical protein